MSSRRAASACVQLSDTAGFVTVAGFAIKAGQRIGFGCRSFMPMTADEALKLDMLINLREMVLAGEPANPLVNPSFDPLDRGWLIFSIRVPLIRERAERLQAAAARLMRAGRGRDG